MRAGFGLVGLLITIGVIVWIMHKSTLPYTQEVLKKGDEARQQVNPIAGYSADGSMKFSDSLVVDTETSGGKISAIDVTKVVPGGPADTAYGLKEGDAILEIGPLSVKDNIQSSDDAMGQLVQFGYERSAPLKIIRDGNQMTLTPNAPKPVAQNSQNKKSDKPKDDMQHEIDLHSLPGMQ
ncbi:MAG TPA: PDZ domain-containing protein [Tepidisphaeraceae bacterium]|nr:PDZ domain-containing protein [Tepidisphaeraceae bacterium]